MVFPLGSTAAIDTGTPVKLVGAVSVDKRSPSNLSCLHQMQLECHVGGCLLGLFGACRNVHGLYPV